MIAEREGRIEAARDAVVAAKAGTEHRRIAEGCNVIALPRDPTLFRLTRRRWMFKSSFASGMLRYYNWIIACEGEPVTSMDKLLGREVDMAEVEDRIEANFRDVFGVTAAASTGG